jgi:hypothetical protein
MKCTGGRELRFLVCLRVFRPSPVISNVTRPKHGTKANSKVARIPKLDVMNTVHIFCSRGRFRSEEDFSRFVMPSYTHDGEMLESEFMREIELSNACEPMAIEREFYSQPTDLLSALYGFSYLDQLRIERTDSTNVDAVVCVYSPNTPNRPASSSLTYVGAYRYEPSGG